LADLRRRQREIRIREPELDKCWKARASAEGEWHRQARRQSGGEELWEAARRTAMEQKRALREKAAETALGKLVSEEARNLGEREAGFRFGQAVLRYQLHGNRSPLASAVERDGEVAKKRESLAALQDDLRNRPSPAAALAAKKAEEAGQERKAAVEEAEKAADFGPVREKARAAEAALRKAQANDPKRKAVEAAKAKYEEKLGAAVAALDQAKPLAAELERVTKELEESAAQAKKLRDEQAGLRRATEQGDDPEVAAAKKKVEQSQKAAKDAEKKAGLSQLSQQLDAARKALAAKQKELIAADPACKAVREEIAAVERDLKALRKPPAPKPPR
jgi:colicin import membrane protein